MNRNVKLGRDQERKCLELIGRFGWLRIQEISMFQWPYDIYRSDFDIDKASKTEVNKYHYAQSLVKKLVADDKVSTQKLPNHAGTVVVLKEKGAKIVRAMGYKKVKRTKLIADDEGHMIWNPGPNWKHDLMIHGFTALAYVDPYFSENEPIFLTEKEQKQTVPENNRPLYAEHDDHIKYTDLLIEREQNGMLGIEFERSRKFGVKNRAPLVKNLIQTNQLNGKTIHNFNGLEPSKIAVAYNPDEKEKTKAGGYKKINHFANIYTSTVKRMRKEGIKNIEFIFFELKIKNFGVISYQSRIFDYDPSFDPTL